MSRSTGIVESLIEKCRKGIKEACDELRKYREWLEKRLDRFEGDVLKFLMGLLITIPLQAIPHVLNIPMLLTILIGICIVLTCIIVSYCVIRTILERHIKKIYEILGDPVMPWRINPSYVIIAISAIVLLILSLAINFM